MSDSTKKPEQKSPNQSKKSYQKPKVKVVKFDKVQVFAPSSGGGSCGGCGY